MLPLGGPIISSTEALAPKALPKHLVVVGGGYIGLELGIAYRKLGAQVSVVEARECILPTYDSELTAPVAESLKKLGIALHLGHSVEGYEDGCLLASDGQGGQLRLEADRVLVAVGRRPRTQRLQPGVPGPEDEGAAIAIDERCQTSMRNVWAIGDVAGEPMLAHRAMAQGEMVAEIIAGKTRRFEPAAIAAVCFTDPEVVVAGKTPEQASQQGLDCIVAQFPLPPTAGP
jgi:Pyruvate/2-oxoglutarate dehydrogenase complex, dihydrolipoamide dehydrogenase (E3) component, and related enzymes